MVIQIEDPNEKQIISRKILEALPEWFALSEAREKYIKDSAEQPFFAAMEEETPIGFL